MKVIESVDRMKLQSSKINPLSNGDCCICVLSH